MKKLVLICVAALVLTAPAYAQLGNLINSIKNSPLVTQQQSYKDILGKVQSISAAFAQLPLNSGKLEFIKAALPLLEQVKGITGNSLQNLDANKPVDAAQTTQASGLLEKVKGLLAQHMPTTPLTPAQVPDATNQVGQLSSVLQGIMQNAGDSLKKLAGLPK